MWGNPHGHDRNPYLYPQLLVQMLHRRVSTGARTAPTKGDVLRELSSAGRNSTHVL